MARQYDNVNTELKTKRAEIKGLMEKKKKLGDRMVSLMNSDGTGSMSKGFKYNGKAFVCKTQSVRVKRRDIDKRNAIREALLSHGLAADDKLIDKLVESGRGVKVERSQVVEKELAW